MHLDYTHDGPFFPGSLPPQLIRLRCGYRYREPLTPGLLPSTLEFLYTGDEFDWSLQPGSLPSNLKDLLFGQAFYHPLPLEVLPTSLTCLEFGLHYDLPLVLPPSLTELILWTPYQPDHTFPQGFPPALKKLKLGEYSNTINPLLLPGILPTTITNLAFNQPVVPRSIPSSVTRLTWGWEEIDVSPVGLIPDSVTHLSFDSEFSSDILPGLIPRSVRKLEIIGQLVANSIPDCVESLILNDQHRDRPLEIGVIPGSVTHLQWYWCRLDIQVRRLPVMTEHGCEFVLISAIPASVTHLRLASFNRRLVSGAIPSSVIYLDLGYHFDQPLLPGSIPDSVKCLELPSSYKHPFLGVIPASTQVIFGSETYFYEALGTAVKLQASILTRCHSC